jgi:hypothetical protein
MKLRGSLGNVPQKNEKLVIKTELWIIKTRYISDYYSIIKCTNNIQVKRFCLAYVCPQVRKGYEWEEGVLIT